MLKDSSPSGLKPGSTERIFMNELSRSPAPESSSTANATCPPTNAERKREPGWSTERPAPCKRLHGVQLVTRSAGNRPAARPAATEMAAATARTGASTATMLVLGIELGAQRRKACTPP